MQNLRHERVRELLKREVGEDNPFIVGQQNVQNYFTVMEECATASKLRNGAK